MIDKKQSKINMRQTKIDVGAQVTQLRKKRGLTIEHLGFQCNTKISYLEKLELGKLEVSLGMLCMLANFFDKRIKIELVDLVEE